MYVPGKGPGLHPSGARGPRLKSLDLPLRVCIYIRTYILTVARTCSCAEPPILSCPVFLRLTPQSPFRRQYYQYSTFCLALHCNAPHIPTALHYIALCCTVVRLHSPCVLPCTIALPPTRALILCRQYTDCTQTLSCPSCPVLFCPLSRISDQPPGTNPARRRASK